MPSNLPPPNFSMPPPGFPSKSMPFLGDASNTNNFQGGTPFDSNPELWVETKTAEGKVNISIYCFCLRVQNLLLLTLNLRCFIDLLLQCQNKRISVDQTGWCESCHANRSRSHGDKSDAAKQ